MLHTIIAIALATSGAAPTAPLPPRIQSDVPLFEFHSGIWINLHHVLYELGRRQRVAQGAQLRGPPEYELTPAVQSLSDADQAAWRSAVDYYAKTWVEKDLLFDPDLARIKGVLSRLENEPTLSGGELPDELCRALNAAVAVYRKAAWKVHDVANREWLRSHAEDLKRHGPSFAKELAQIFAEPWPADRVRVDLVAEASDGLVKLVAPRGDGGVSAAVR